MKYLIIFTLSILFFSCNNNDPDNLAVVQLKDTFKKDLNDYKAIVFIPSQGCSGCINGIEDFLINTYIPSKKDNLLFVITGYNSIKSVRVRLGNEVLDHEDILLDLQEVFNRPPFMIQYPKVLSIESGKYAETIQIDPNSRDSVYEYLNSI